MTRRLVPDQSGKRHQTVARSGAFYATRDPGAVHCLVMHERGLALGDRLVGVTADESGARDMVAGMAGER